MQQNEFIETKRRDYRVTFVLAGVDDRHTRDLGLAVKRVIFSHLNTKLILKIGHYIDTEVHHLVEYICRNGIDVCIIEAMHPTRRDLVNEAGHQQIRYTTGMVTDQATVFSREEEDSEDLMTDELEITFLHKESTFRRWVPTTPIGVTQTEDKIVTLIPRNRTP